MVVGPPELVPEDGPDVAAGVVRVHPKAATGYRYRNPEEPAQVQGLVEQEHRNRVVAMVRTDFDPGILVVETVVG